MPTTSLLDSVVLAILSKSDEYGYNLTQIVKKVLNVSESTLYPVLRRLQKNGFLEVYDQIESGRNRRYYKITCIGRQQLKVYLKEWEDYKQKFDEILGGAEID